MDTVAYEWVPARLDLPAIPVVARETFTATTAQVKRSEREILICGAQTLSTSVATVLEGRQRALKHWRQLAREASVPALYRQLQDHPELMTVPEVREKVIQLVRARRWRAPRGRPARRYACHPLVVRGLVMALIDGGSSRNLEQALGLLDEWNFLSHDAAKTLYYQSFNEQRFQALMWQFDDERRPATAAEAQHFAAAEQLRPGDRLRRKGTDALGNEIDVVVAADT